MPPTVGVNVNLNTIIEQIGNLLTEFTGVPSQINGILSELVEMHSDINSKLDGVRTDISDITAVLGQALGGPETTMQSLLIQIRENTLCDQGKCAPGPDDVGGCPDPFISTGTVASSDYGGRSFAIWNVASLPAGITEGDFLEFDIAQAQLVHDVEGTWALFVHSNGSPTFSISPDLDTIYPTNQWIDITANLDLAINTPTGTDCVAYICTPVDFPFTECIDIDASLCNYQHTYNDFVDVDMELYAVPWGFVPSQGLAMHAEWGGGPIEEVDFDLLGGICTSNAQGYVITWLSGDIGQLSIEWIDNTGAKDQSNIGAVGLSYTIPDTTVAVWITNRLGATPGSSPFSVTICPAGL